MGHIDIISRASKLFDKVIVTVMTNPNKTNAAFSVEERVELLRRSIKDIKNAEVDASMGLLAEYAKEKGACAIVKGLRAVSDYEYEFQQALMNKTMNCEVETVFLVTGSENMFLSSSVVKEVCSLGGDISPFVPAAIHDDIVKRLYRKGVN
jgi:pantetheine-phosphate adenylyltransferase